MKTTADRDSTKRTRVLLLALGAVCVGCVLMIAAAVLAGRNYKALVPLALVSSIVVNAIAVALSRFQEEAERK